MILNYIFNTKVLFKTSTLIIIIYEEIRVSFIIIKISNVNMFILCDLKGQCLNHDHIAHVYEYMGAEC